MCLCVNVCVYTYLIWFFHLSAYYFLKEDYINMYIYKTPKIHLIKNLLSTLVTAVIRRLSPLCRKIFKPLEVDGLLKRTSTHIRQRCLYIPLRSFVCVLCLLMLLHAPQLRARIQPEGSLRFGCRFSHVFGTLKNIHTLATVIVRLVYFVFQITEILQPSASFLMQRLEQGRLALQIFLPLPVPGVWLFKTHVFMDFKDKVALGNTTCKLRESDGHALAVSFPNIQAREKDATTWNRVLNHRL